MESHEEDEIGPIDVIVIGYPPGAPMSGEAMPLFLDLVDRGTIRVLDALFVAKAEDGSVSGFDAADLDVKDVGDFEVLAGASSACWAATTSDRRRGAGPRVRSGHDRLREPLGGAVRRRGPPQRRGGDRQRPDPRAGRHRCPRRRRSGGLNERKLMPGLLRGIARTAVIAGTATSVSNRVSRRQASAGGQQDAPAYEEAPPQAAPPRPRHPTRSNSSSSWASCTSRACSPTRSLPRRRRRSWASRRREVQDAVARAQRSRVAGVVVNAG